MPNYFKENVKFLRGKKGLSQDETATALNLGRSTWTGYEKGDSTPNVAGLYKIGEYFDVSVSELLETNLAENVHLNKNEGENKSKIIVHPKVHRNVHPNADFRLTIAAEPDPEYSKKHLSIPITDISVAAGAGIYNSEYIEHTDHVSFPTRLVKKGALHLAIRVKGASMAPTLQEDSYVIIRLLDKAEWAEMGDKRVYVVCDMDGKGYLKRVKNRFKQDFIVLTSDSPDKATYSNFNLYTSEIHHIWEAVAKVEFRMPNIHDQYYSKLEQLEDKVEELSQIVQRINPQLK